MKISVDASLKIEKCDDDFLWNISYCECEYSKAAKLTTAEECEEINDDDISNKKTILMKEYIEHCKPFIASSILFLLIAIILTVLFVYFYVNSKLTNILT